MFCLYSTGAGLKGLGNRVDSHVSHSYLVQAHTHSSDPSELSHMAVHRKYRPIIIATTTIIIN